MVESPSNKLLTKLGQWLLVVAVISSTTACSNSKLANSESASAKTSADISANKNNREVSGRSMTSNSNQILVGGTTPAPFSPKAWKDAKESSPWSREKLLVQFLNQYQYQLDQKKIDRTKLIALLGTPDMTVETLPTPNFPGGATAPTDHYRLSTDNEPDFVVEYDASGSVESYNQVNNEPCGYRGFIDPTENKRSSKATLANAKLIYSAQNIDHVIEVMGPPLKSDINIRSNRPPGDTRYSTYYWNLSDDGRQTLIVTTSGAFGMDLGKRSIVTSALFTFGKDYPAFPYSQQKSN